MDVSVLVAAVFPYLSAAVAVYGRSVVERVEDQAEEAAADATVGLGRRILRRLLGRAESREAIEGAVSDLADSPGDEDFQAAVRAQLKKALAADPALAAELAGELERAGVTVTAAGERSIAGHTISGIAVTGDDAHIQR